MNQGVSSGSTDSAMMARTVARKSPARAGRLSEEVAALALGEDLGLVVPALEL